MVNKNVVNRIMIGVTIVLVFILGIFIGYQASGEIEFVPVRLTKDIEIKKGTAGFFIKSYPVRFFKPIRYVSWEGPRTVYFANTPGEANFSRDNYTLEQSR